MIETRHPVIETRHPVIETRHPVIETRHPVIEPVEIPSFVHEPRGPSHGAPV